MNLQPIAYLRSPFADKFGVPRQGNLAPHVISEIVFEPAYAQAECLRGIEGFSHLWVIWGFHCNDGAGWHPTVRPPRLGGNERVGVFASRSSFRPNPLGLSVLKLEAVQSVSCLQVSGADMVDGTPIYDIKPYIPYADAIPDAASGYTAQPWQPLQVRITANLPRGVSPAWVEGLREVLAQDPRPAYQQNPERVYHIIFRPYDVAFRVENDTAYVLSFAPEK